MGATAHTSHSQEDYEVARYELARLAMSRKNFAYYCEYVYGWPVRGVPMHLEWDAHIEDAWSRGLNPGILAPRDHGKSSRLARARMTWELGRSTLPDAWCPSIRIKLFQNTDKNAIASTMVVRSDLASPRFRRVFPGCVPDPDYEWSKHALYLKRTSKGRGRASGVRDPSFEGRSITAAATSGRADLIAFDDICDLKNSVLEPASREKIVQIIKGDIINLGEPHTRKFAIGTAWHELDANADLQRSEAWTWQTYRIQDEPGAKMQVHWPGKWDIPALEHRRLEIGDREFERGFNNRPWGDADSLVNWESVKDCMDRDLALGDEPFNTSIRIAGYDLAIGKGEDASYFAAVVLGMGGDGTIIPLEIVRTHCPFRQQVETVRRLEARWAPAVHVVESNAYQQALVDQIEQELEYVVVEPFITTKMKADPYVGLPSLGPAFDQHRIVLPVKGGHDGTDPACDCEMCAFLRELRWFPAATSDIVMAWWFAFNKIRHYREQAASFVKAHKSELA